MTTEIADAELMAFVDGELDEVQRTRVERALARDPGLRRRADSLRVPGEALRAALDPIAAEPIPAAILRAALPQDRAAPRAPWRQLAAPLAMAASLALVVGGFGGAWFAGPEQHQQRAPAAQVWLGALHAEAAAILDNLPSGATGVWRDNGPGLELQPVLSFLDAGARVCRQFVARGAATFDAVACRSPEGGWQLVAALARAPVEATAGDAYRPASGAPASAIDSLVDALAVEPLLPSREAELLRDQWHVPTDAAQ